MTKHRTYIQQHKDDGKYQASCRDCGWVGPRTQNPSTSKGYADEHINNVGTWTAR